MKWFGQIAFSNQVETEPGVYEDNDPILRDYYGDVIKNYKRDNSASTSNPDISISNQLSVVADPFLLNSFHEILYVTFMGTKWSVSSVDIQYPRMVIDFGNKYGEDTE